MQRRFNPWVVVLTAALTFGSLMAFVGPRLGSSHRFGAYGQHAFGHRWYGYGAYRTCHGNGHGDAGAYGPGRDNFRRNNPDRGSRNPRAYQRPAEPKATDSL